MQYTTDCTYSNAAMYRILIIIVDVTVVIKLAVIDKTVSSQASITSLYWSF